MSARILIAVFSGSFFLFLGLGLPLSVLAGPITARHGLDFDRAAGTVWDGTLYDVSAGGQLLGDLRLRLDPLYLVLARLRAVFSFEGSDVVGSGVFETGLGSYRALKDAEMTIAVDRLPSNLELSGDISLNEVSLVIDGKGCRSAKGNLSTDILSHGALDLQWQGPVLNGAIECRQGALRVPLAGVRGAESISVETSFFIDHRYEARVAVETENRTLLEVLPLIGFWDDGDALALVQTGQWSIDQGGQAYLGG